MRLIAEHEVRSDETRYIQLLQGDLTAVPPEHRCDVLVVSAFEGVYSPTHGTLVRALNNKGLSVSKLAFEKEVDLRRDFCCWMSKEIEPINGIPFKRLLGFEPGVRGKAPLLVGDIFRALDPFVQGPMQVRSIAMPLVATGRQGFSIESILPPLLEAARSRLAEGYPLRTIKIVAYSNNSAATAEKIFRKHVERWNVAPPSISHFVQPGTVVEPTYDVFVSYSRQDKAAARCVAAELRKAGLRVFIDEMEIDNGASWQQRIFDALEKCRSAVTVYSPHFTKSKMCQDEFSIAMILRRRRGDNFIHPILAKDTDLPAYMEMLNYDDCRVDDTAKLSASAQKLAQRLRQSS